MRACAGVARSLTPRPDRLDALVWAVTELTARQTGGPRIRTL
jgi:phage terminase large subunit-like protein